jgi:glucose-6-phosphate dehydrogenase-like protein
MTERKEAPVIIGELSDPLVFLGATGDLAHKMIFPALQALVKRARLEVPVIGVAKEGWNLGQSRALDSLESFGGGVDRIAFGQALRAAALHRRRLSRAPNTRSPSAGYLSRSAFPPTSMYPPMHA